MDNESANLNHPDVPVVLNPVPTDCLHDKASTTKHYNALQRNVIGRCIEPCTNGLPASKYRK